MNKHIKETDLRPITVLVTLDQLRHGSEYPDGSVNSRKQYRERDIEQLAYSLLPQNDGQLKPLLCCTHKSTPNVWFVFDGGRRERGFELAIAKALLPKAHPIEIKDYGQISPELAHQLSWAANEQVPLHPADRAEGFAKLSAQKTAEQIADERGMSVRAVQQSIALGTTLAPEVIAAWRADKLTREDVEVFTMAPDLESQAKALNEDYGFRNGRSIDRREVRRKLLRNKEPEMKRLLGFVGADAAIAAGVDVKLDFFGSGGVVKDLKGLKKLATAKMAGIAADLEKAGWSWVDTRMTESNMHHGCGEMRATLKHTADEKKRLAAIAARLKVIENDESEDEALFAEENALGEEKDLIDGAARLRSFDAKQKAKGGVIVSLTGTGVVKYQAGLTRKDEPKAKSKAAAPSAPPREPDVDSAVEDALDDIQRKAVQTLIVAKPREAFALFLAAATQGMYGCVEWQDLGDGDEISKARSLSGAYEQLKSLSLEKLAARLAAAMGRVTSLDGSTDGQVVIQVLGEKALQAEFTKLFVPKDYVAGASKLHLLGILAETLGESARKTHEKEGEAALRLPVMTAIKAKGWLPAQLRTKAYVGPTVKKAAAPKGKKGGKQ